MRRNGNNELHLSLPKSSVGFRWLAGRRSSPNPLLLLLLGQVKFPLEGLDLSRYVLPARGGQGSSDPRQALLYDCYAVSNHYGGQGAWAPGGPAGGHYTAFVKMPGGGQWYRFDDSSPVEPISTAEVSAEGEGGGAHSRR